MKKRNTTKRLAIAFAAIIVLIIVSTCVCAAEGSLSGWLKSIFGAKESETIEYTLSDESNPVATLKMKDGGTIVIELFPDVAPNTVANFIALANSGYYDGLIFHRVISGFMIQGGDPTGTGSGGPGYSIKGEFSQNGFENNLAHTRGVISMARSSKPDSAGSQFFIMHQDAPHLNGGYAAFGRVVYGMETVDKIASTATDSKDRPKTEQKIESIRVDTKGVEYEVIKIGG